MFARAAFVLCTISIASCSGGSSASKAQAPLHDAAALAQAALQEYDKNKTGSIDAAELDACPALKYALRAMDTNGDGKLSAAEIESRVASYPRRNIGVTCTVMLDGQPAAGLTVTFEPEKFMGAAAKPATTTTDSSGSGSLFQVEGHTAADLPPGFYRIRVTKEGAKLPARYNTQTILGREVNVEPRQGDMTIELAISTR